MLRNSFTQTRRSNRNEEPVSAWLSKVSQVIKVSDTGPGLNISFDIITEDRGRIQAENNPPAGAPFGVWLL